jgi:hypothetical protein
MPHPGKQPNKSQSSSPHPGHPAVVVGPAFDALEYVTVGVIIGKEITIGIVGCGCRCITCGVGKKTGTAVVEEPVPVEITEVEVTDGSPPPVFGVGDITA